MESFDLKNVWNALTTMERETIIDAAKDSQGVSCGHYSSVVKGILLSASSAGRVDLSYRDPLFWSAADVLREQGIAEAALRQQKAKLDAETPAEVDESSYPAYVQQNRPIRPLQLPTPRVLLRKTGTEKSYQGVVHFSSTERDWELGAVRRRTSINSDQTETAC